MKSNDPEKFRQILRQSEYFYDFLHDKLSVTSNIRFYQNLGSQEMT